MIMRRLRMMMMMMLMMMMMMMVYRNLVSHQSNLTNINQLEPTTSAPDSMLKLR